MTRQTGAQVEAGRPGVAKRPAGVPQNAEDRQGGPGVGGCNGAKASAGVASSCGRGAEGAARARDSLGSSPPEPEPLSPPDPDANTGTHCSRNSAARTTLPLHCCVHTRRTPSAGGTALAAEQCFSSCALLQMAGKLGHSMSDSVRQLAGSMGNQGRLPQVSHNEYLQQSVCDAIVQPQEACAKNLFPSRPSSIPSAPYATALSSP